MSNPSPILLLVWWLKRQEKQNKEVERKTPAPDKRKVAHEPQYFSNDLRIRVPHLVHYCHVLGIQNKQQISNYDITMAYNVNADSISKMSRFENPAEDNAMN